MSGCVLKSPGEFLQCFAPYRKRRYHATSAVCGNSGSAAHADPAVGIQTSSGGKMADIGVCPPHQTRRRFMGGHQFHLLRILQRLRLHLCIGDPDSAAGICRGFPRQPHPSDCLRSGNLRTGLQGHRQNCRKEIRHIYRERSIFYGHPSDPLHYHGHQHIEEVHRIFHAGHDHHGGAFHGLRLWRGNRPSGLHQLWMLLRQAPVGMPLMGAASHGRRLFCIFG